MLKESPLRKLIDVIDVPLSHIPELVYKTSVDDWIDQHPIMTLCGFVLFSCNRIFTKLAAQQGGAKGGEDPVILEFKFMIYAYARHHFYLCLCLTNSIMLYFFFFFYD